MSNQSNFHAKEHPFFGSLLGAFAGVGLIGLSIHLGASDDFLATLITKGGRLMDYILGAAVLASFVLGVALIAKHVAKEGVAEHFYEHTPY